MNRYRKFVTAALCVCLPAFFFSCSSRSKADMIFDDNGKLKTYLFTKRWVNSGVSSEEASRIIREMEGSTYHRGEREDQHVSAFPAVSFETGDGLVVSLAPSGMLTVIDLNSQDKQAVNYVRRIQ